MSLNSAHAGYAYQDLLCSFFILEEIISENDSTIRIDQKEVNDDRFDDIVIKNKSGVFRKQVKYSDSKDDGHTLTKDDFASDGNYNLALHSLFKSWESYPENERGDLKICLSWNNPDSSDAILDVLRQVDSSSFDTFNTTTYSIDLDKLWVEGKRPLNSWRKFKNESTAIQRDDFFKFIQVFVIEVNLPKASLDIYSPGELERILIEQVRKLGVGEYPNKELSVQETILALTQIVTNARARGLTLNTSQVLKQLRVKTDYGRIEQQFPVNPARLIETKNSVDTFEKIILDNNKVIITGEPGAGKSWFINNLESSLKKKFLFAKHYCYTDLKDELQIDRIKVNTLYGNLIAEILEHFPELKKHKNQIWASNLDELNILISHVSQNLLIIIDGLDHVQRIYDLKKSVVAQAEVDILNAIEEIDLNSDKVKIIVLTQPIPELQKFERFVKVSLPKWSEVEVLKCMTINEVSDLKLSNGEKLSTLLAIKSDGNPLYLSYLIEEIKYSKDIGLEKINELPAYSYNLSEYYEYILLKINEGSTVPKLFSGVNFSLTKNELVEITGMGDYVENDILAMLPILKLNISTGGYSIYHESFRRFIIEKLTSSRVDIWQNIFKPIAEWLEKKGFFEFNKSSKFYFPLLYENNKWHEIARFIHVDFIKKSLYHGHSWGLIEANFKYLALSSSLSKSFENLIILAEQSRILVSVDVEYKEIFSEYFKALGAVLGYEVAANLLVLDGLPTVEKSLGLKACRICEYNGVVAPWNLYNSKERKGDSILLEEFSDYIVFLLSNKKYANIEHIAKQLNRDDSCKVVFQKEVKKWLTYSGELDWLESTPTTNKILFPKVEKVSIGKLTKIRDSLLGIDYIRDEVKNDIQVFFKGLIYLCSNGKYNEVEILIKPFVAKNWFYNWLIFFGKIKIIAAKKNNNIAFYFNEIEEAFKYLIYDTEVFKGKIRTCDLYGIGGIIHDSIKEGLSCIYAEEERQKIVDLLQDVSHRTTTTMQNSPGGPLTPSALLEILSEYDTEHQIDATIKKYEEELESESLKRFYQSTSEYYFRLAVLYSKKGNKAKGDDCFKKGIQFLLSYTFRKDTTLGELIDSVSSLNSCSSELGIEYIRKLKVMADTVVNHTDGRTTNWYPVEWFKEFYKISPRESLLFLAHELFTVRHDWRLEDNLKHFLIATTGKINPLIELQIARTFPVADSKDFLKNAFDLSYKTKQEHTLLSNNSLKLFLTKLYIGRDTSYSDEFLNDAGNLSDLLDVTPRKPLKKQEKYPDKRNVRVEEVLKKNFHLSRAEFSKMSNAELIVYCELESIPEKDSQGLYLRIKQMEWGSEKKEVISLLARKDRYVTDSNHKWAELIFQDDIKESIFFYISKFIYQHGGWFEYFVNIEDFKKAYQLNQELAIDFLFELLPPLLSKPAFTHKFSANLVNSLVEVGFPAEKVINLWKTLYDIIDDRLPGKSEYEWDKEIPNEFREFSNEELLVILLISRIRSFSSERTHWALSGLKYLLIHSSSVLINPIKWFLKNAKEFLEINLLSVLQLLYEYKIVDEQYSLNFKIELENIYPSNFFLIDWIIEQLIDLEAREKLMEPIVYSKPSKQFSEFFKRINLRHFNLERIGFDLDDVFGEYQNSFKRNHKDVHDLYYSRVNKLFLDNLYAPNYMLSLINKRLYNDFRDFEFFYGEEVYHLLKLKDNELTAQCFSITNRPKDLKRPLELIASKSGEVQMVNGWVRLAFYEEENYQEEFLKDFKKFKSYGAVVFSNPEIIESEQFPFSRYILYINRYFNMELPDSDFDGFTTVMDIQDDMYESLRILWIAPQLFSWLKFEMLPLVNGLCAKNSDGEIVLKYNAWKEDYLGASFDEEIPKLSGSELLIREDYYNQIASHCGNMMPRFISNSFEIN